MQQEQNKRGHDHTELSDTWLELLGARVPQAQAQANTDEAGIPVLDSDPWRHLLQGKDIAQVDLQKISLHETDQDVERALQVMQEKNHDTQS